MDSTQSILHSAKRFFSGTILSRVSGLLRDMAMAFAFGTQDTVAAFLVAFRFSHLLRRLLGEGALQTAFIPQFEKLRYESPEKAGAFFRDLFTGLSLLLVGVVLLAMGGLGAVLYFVEMSEGNREIVWLTLLMMPSLLFICLFGINASLLQCEKSFFLPSVAPVLFNLVWISGVVGLWYQETPWAMSWLSGFIIVACLCQWLITLPQVLGILRSYNTQWGQYHFFSRDVLNMTGPLLLGLLGVAASQINNALDSVFARYADKEGPAFLWYAIRMQQLPLALFGIALSGALLPPLSRAIKMGDVPRYQMFLEFALSRSIALMLPITFVLFIMGENAVSVLFGRGDFTAESIAGTSQCLWGYAAGLIPMTIVLILAPAFYAKEDYRTPACASLAAVGTNIALNALFVVGFHWGTASVAFATSISAWLNALWLALAVRQQFGTIGTSSLILSISKIFGVTLVATLPFFFVDLSGFNVFIRLGLQIFVFVGIMTAVGWLVKARELLVLAKTSSSS